MNPLDSTPFQVPRGVTTRWASPENWGAEKGKGGMEHGGRKGSSCFFLDAGQTRTLAHIQGHSGVLRRIWFTTFQPSPLSLRALRLEIFWDGAARPAVSVPMGDFFGHTVGRMSRFDSALLSSPEARSFNCCFAMPFRKSVKVTLTNDAPQQPFGIYYDIDMTLGDAIPDDACYFHAHWRRENPTTIQQDFQILPRVEGRGRFLGTVVGVRTLQDEYTRTWWGEGEAKIYLDGDDEWPTLVGTGTEDYIGTGYGQGRFANLYQGCHIAEHDTGLYGFYRYHLPDPVYFQQDILVAMQQMGDYGPHTRPWFHFHDKPLYKAGPGLEPLDVSPGSDIPESGRAERRDDWCACAYFYLDRPESGLPPLAPIDERLADLPDSAGAGQRLDQ